MTHPTQQTLLTWLVATVWARLHRDHHPHAEVLWPAIGAGDAAQRAALLALPRELDGLSTRERESLAGPELQGVAQEADLGGVRLADLDRALPADDRGEALGMTALLLDDLGSPAAPHLRASLDADLVGQLCWLWRAWTTPQLDSFAMALVALTRASILGRVPRDELLFVVSRHDGLA